jgi:hypothetical protein
LSEIGISCTDHTNDYCTLFPLIGISCTDHSNGYCTLFPLIGISCTDHTNDYCTLCPLIGISCTWSAHEIPIRGNNLNNYLSDQYMKYQLEGTM